MNKLITLLALLFTTNINAQAFDFRCCTGICLPSILKLNGETVPNNQNKVTMNFYGYEVYQKSGYNGYHFKINFGAHCDKGYAAINVWMMIDNQQEAWYGTTCGNANQFILAPGYPFVSGQTYDIKLRVTDHYDSAPYFSTFDGEVYIQFPDYTHP